MRFIGFCCCCLFLTGLGAAVIEDQEPAQDPTVSALLEAIDDEYRAWAFYDQVIRDHGPVRPFVNLRDGELRHADALAGELRRLGASVPANPWVGKVEAIPDLAAARAAAVAAEEANVALYARLIAQVEDGQARIVLIRLAAASADHHLPALRGERGRHGGPAVNGGGQPGGGPGGCGGGGQGGCGGGGGKMGCALPAAQPAPTPSDEPAEPDPAAVARAKACGCGREVCACGGAAMALPEGADEPAVQE